MLVWERQRAVGLREAIGERPLPLADRTSRGLCCDAGWKSWAMLINGLDLAEARPRKDWLRRIPAA